VRCILAFIIVLVVGARQGGKVFNLSGWLREINIKSGNTGVLQEERWASECRQQHEGLFSHLGAATEDERS
jgi:hypothetical protein